MNYMTLPPKEKAIMDDLHLLAQKHGVIFELKDFRDYSVVSIRDNAGLVIDMLDEDFKWINN